MSRRILLVFLSERIFTSSEYLAPHTDPTYSRSRYFFLNRLPSRLSKKLVFFLSSKYTVRSLAVGNSPGTRALRRSAESTRLRSAFSDVNLVSKITLPAGDEPFICISPIVLKIL